MNKVATIYWDNSIPQTARNTRMQTRTTKTRETTVPQWFAFAIIAAISFMLCLAINFRAFSELNTEVREYESLNNEIHVLMNQNALIQSDISGLKSDPKVIEREARKLGMGRADEKIFVPTN